MKQTIARFRSEEDGLAAVEYALIAGLICLTLMIGAGLLGQSITQRFGDIGAEVAK